MAYTYAAIAIERILFMKHNKQPLYVPKEISALRYLEMTSLSRFTPLDVAPWANLAILALLTKIEGGGSPEKASENDYLMKCKRSVYLRTKLIKRPFKALCALSSRLVQNLLLYTPT